MGRSVFRTPFGMADMPRQSSDQGLRQTTGLRAQALRKSMGIKWLIKKHTSFGDPWNSPLDHRRTYDEVSLKSDH